MKSNSRTKPWNIYIYIYIYISHWGILLFFNYWDFYVSFFSIEQLFLRTFFFLFFYFNYRVIRVKSLSLRLEQNLTCISYFFIYVFLSIFSNSLSSFFMYIYTFINLNILFNDKNLALYTRETIWILRFYE